MKRYSFIFFGILMAFSANSQNETDALRYSYLNYNGTARYAGLGGAMGALGADMSAISMNPAGMGRYSRSDFSFTGDLTISFYSLLLILVSGCFMLFQAIRLMKYKDKQNAIRLMYTSIFYLSFIQIIFVVDKFIT